MQAFDERRAYSNKLLQLGSPALQDADHVVMCDCDVAFAGSLAPSVPGVSVAAKRVDTANPRPAMWEAIFVAAGFGAPPGAALSTRPVS